MFYFFDYYNFEYSIFFINFVSKKENRVPKILKIIMKNNNILSFITLLLIVCCYSLQEASAQFNIRPNTSTNRVESGIDTVKLNIKAQSSPLDLSVYSDAYDKYLRSEIFKFRNKLNFQSSLAITQSSMDNWAAGGSNSFSGRLWFKLVHNYNHTTSNFSLISTLEGAYTMLITDETTTKSEDFLNLTSTPSWKIAPKWDFSGSLILKTQFTDTYATTTDTVISSTFFAPAYLNLSAGITYSPPKGEFKAYFAPISGNATFVLNSQLSALGAYGVEVGERSLTQFGAFSRIEYTTKFLKDKATFTTKAESFWNYEDCPNLTVEARLSFEFSKLFGATIYAKTIYDETVNTPRISQNNFWQFFQSTGFTLTFSFNSKTNTSTEAEIVSRLRR